MLPKAGAFGTGQIWLSTEETIDTMGRRERGRAGHSTDGREAKERPRQNAGAIFEQAGNKENGGCTPAPPRWLDRLLGESNDGRI